MRVPREVACLVALLGTLLAAAPAWPGAAAEDPLAKRVQILEDLGKSDTERVRACEYLLQKGGPGIDALVGLGKTTANDNVRLHVAIALANGRTDRPKPEETQLLRSKVAANLDLFVSWLAAKEADPSLHYWAARAIAFTETRESIEILKKVISTSPDPTLRTAIARSLGSWETDSLVKEAIPALTDLLKDRDAGVRVAAVEGLRVTGRNKREVVLPLFAAAKADPDEAVWRSAVVALRSVTKILITAPTRATPPKEREVLFRDQESDWLRRMKQKPAKEGEGEG